MAAAKLQLAPKDPAEISADLVSHAEGNVGGSQRQPADSSRRRVAPKFKT